MRVKKDNKAEIARWLETNRLTKCPLVAAPTQSTHVAFVVKGKWAPKGVKRGKPHLTKKQRAAEFKRKQAKVQRMSRSRNRYKARIQKYKAKKFDETIAVEVELDGQMKQAMDRDE